MTTPSLKQILGYTKTTHLLCLIVGMFAVMGCGSFGLYDSDDSKVIARVGDKELRESAIEEIYNGVLSSKDSIQLRQTAIQNWIDEQIKQNAALEMFKNDKSSEKMIEEMVQQYRMNLLSYTFEQNFLQQNLDTMVTEAQIQEYYDKNGGSFKLIGPLVKAIVVRLPLELRQSTKLEKMFTKGGSDEMIEFLNICKKNNYKVDDFRDQWVEFSEVLQTLPFKGTDYDNFLKSKRGYDVRDDQYHYLLRIEECMLSGEPSPLERERETITRILRNQRREELLKEFNDSLINSAYNNQTVLIEGELEEELVIAVKQNSIQN